MSCPPIGPPDDEHTPTKRSPSREVVCMNWPTTKQLRKAKKGFGEGFTWTCPECGEQLVLAQGKGDYWRWKSVP